uniref:Uncharacterized protein n=1 Tax=viral metagenome TaxID=1070528 RepID=A0A6M3IHG9_9ZZZZ
MIIKITQPDLGRLIFALEKVKSMLMLQKDDMQYYCSTEYHQFLLQNLNEQVFAGSYTPYTQRYAVFKGAYRTLGAMRSFHPKFSTFAPVTGDFWKLAGDLAKNIVKRKFGRGGWAVGVNDIKVAGKSWFGTDYAGKAKSLGMIAIVNEFGGNYGQGGRHPGRHLFTPSREIYAKMQWPMQGDKSLNKVGNSWS